MYWLWDNDKIKFPSEYWNASRGDKLCLRVFREKKIEEKNKERTEIKNNKVPVFLTESI